MNQKHPWPKDKIKCVVMCGGSGTRLLPLSFRKQKSMLELSNKPVLSLVIDYWSNFSNDFIFVVKHKKEEVINYIKTLPLNIEFVEPKELRGIADGLFYAKDSVSDNFIVVLSDCLCRGKFFFPRQMRQGVGVWKTNDLNHIRNSYSIETNGKFLKKVIEKPKIIFNDLCGMGFYFLNKKVFDYIEKTPPSKLRNEVEITDVIQNMIDAQEKISPVFFEGDYLNINRQIDLKKAKQIFG